jgi:hypothetical protein
MNMSICTVTTICRDSAPLTRCSSGAEHWLQHVLVLVVGVEGEIKKIIRKNDAIVAVFANRAGDRRLA